MLRLWSGRVDYVGGKGEVVLNTTAKSAEGFGRVFAPTWELVMSSKRGKISWEEYVEGYLELMRERYKQDKEVFEAVVRSELDVVVCCYCGRGKGRKCHRYLLVEVLEKVGLSMGIEVKYMGEVVKKGRKFEGKEYRV